MKTSTKKKKNETEGFTYVIRYLKIYLVVYIVIIKEFNLPRYDKNIIKEFQTVQFQVVVITF